MDELYAKNLLNKYHKGECTDAERTIVEDWVAFGTFPDYSITEKELDLELSSIGKTLPLLVRGRKIVLYRTVAAAAVIFLALGIGWYYYFNSGHQHQVESALTHDIPPGGIGGMLTLANGKKVSLLAASKGELARQDGVSIQKIAEGEILYQVNTNSPLPSDQINVLSTARGQTFMLVLPDHSKVWLNALSSLTYSVSLNNGGVRKVILSGEAYFEVARDKTHPFIVESKGQRVEVLGTHFNIASYGDENGTKTTLLEGAVKINDKILAPGQQSIQQNGNIKIENVDADEAVTWKNGYFQFDQENLSSVMRKIARWYDVEIVYEDEAVKNEIFSGTISRYNTVSQVLKKIALTDAVSYQGKGKKIVLKLKK